MEEGAAHLHVVDLDGARAGCPVNLQHLARIASELGVPVQLGGGLRTLQAIEDALQAGAQRAILGTAALTDPELLDAALARWPERMRRLRRHARWAREYRRLDADERSTAHELIDAPSRARRAATLCTPTSTAMGCSKAPTSPKWRSIARATRGRLTYSGGIGSLADLEGLKALAEPSLTGVIVGKALYEGRFTVAAARTALGEKDVKRPGGWGPNLLGLAGRAVGIPRAPSLRWVMCTSSASSPASMSTTAAS